MNHPVSLLLSAVIASTAAVGGEPPAAARMLVPGFTIRELPVSLTSLNNIEYAPDGRLFAGGYDGRFHVLRISPDGKVEQLAQAGGAVAKIKKSDIARTEPMTVSLMPPGLEKTLTATELRDLMAYLLTLPARPAQP